MTVGLSGDLSNLLQDVQTAVSSAGVSNASASDTNTSAQNSVSSASQTSEDCAIDTRFLAGCDLTEYTAKIEEGLKGENKAFFERLKNRGIETTFAAYDTDGNGRLSGQEAIGVSSAGINQRKFSKAINGGGLSAFMDKMLSQIGTMNTSGSYSSILSSLGSLTGGASSVAGTSSSAAVNFALQFAGKSAADMSGMMSATGFHSGAWCADFVYYCLSKAGLVPEGYDSINHAYCPSIAQWARQNGRAFTDPSQAKPGDLLIMNSEGHIGIVTKVDSEGIHTIEGNTSNSSGAYDGPGGGGWVCEKVRSFSCVSTFVRI